jgi:small conductance mechanosensitive channel
MHLFSNTHVCDTVNNGTVCNVTYDITHNDQLAVASDWIIGKPLAIVVLILIGLGSRWILHRVIDRLASRAGEGMRPGHFSRVKRAEAAGSGPASESIASARRAQRAKTMADLLKNVITAVIVTMITTMVISELGYNVAPLIASAGVIGIALGFGAQSLVKDYLAGIFMIFEDQYGVGDVVDVGEASGTIEAVSLRVTRLRDVNGTVWYVRNGEILRVGNMSQNWARAVLDIPVSYSEDLHRVKAALQDVAHSLWDDEDYKHLVIEEPGVWGVQSFMPDGVLVRVTLKTAPLEQWAVGREMLERIKARFDYEGIEIAMPQRVVWHRDASSRPHPGAPDVPAPQG